METHVKVMGVIYLAVGACMLLAALFLGVTMGGVAGFVRATSEPRDANIAIPVLGFASAAMVLFFGILALPSAITGYGLLNFRPWSRIVGIILSAISLVIIPIGTVLGAYGLWVLLNKETELVFNRIPSPPAPL